MFDYVADVSVGVVSDDNAYIGGVVVVDSVGYDVDVCVAAGICGDWCWWGCCG